MGAAALIGAALAAVWVSGHFEGFGADRGLLQLVVAVPLTSLGVSAALASQRLLTPRQMLWALLPVEGLVLLGTAVIGPGVRAWPWAILLSCVMLIPWILGMMLGSSLARRRAARRAGTS